MHHFKHILQVAGAVKDNLWFSQASVTESHRMAMSRGFSLDTSAPNYWLRCITDLGSMMPTEI